MRLLRLLRSGLFWLGVGSLAFIVLMYESATLRLTPKEREEAQEQRAVEGKDTQGLSPFAVGLLAVTAVGAFWFINFHLANAPVRKERDQEGHHAN